MYLNHVITKTYSQLRGFSTDSIFARPAYVADTVVNMHRLPDGTFSPRRGYQAQTADIGGLGNSVFENIIDGETQDICISSDGNLYKKRSGTMTIAFSGTDPSEYVSYEIYVDPATISDTTEYDFDPHATVAESALVNDSINFRFKKLTFYSGIAIGSGTDLYSGFLANVPITPGSVVMTDTTDLPPGTLTVADDANGSFTGDINTGITAVHTIDYISGAYAIRFSAPTVHVTASYKGLLQNEFDQRMGKGFGSSSPYLISTLITQLSATSGITVTDTGNTNYPGAFLEVCEETNIASGQSAEISYYWWEPVNRTMATTFSGLLSRLPYDDFQNAVFAAYQEVIYIANVNDNVQKFDGQTVYRAGMPNGAVPSVALNAGGAGVDIGAHTYYITYEQVDATGRLVEGALSPGVEITIAGAASDIDVTVDNLIQATGWNTNSAVIDGAQAAVNTIKVLPGHTIREGDSAFFLDATGLITYERLVTGISYDSITVAGAAVAVDDTMDWQTPISNDLKINIYRTRVGGSIPCLVATIPNNSYQATTTYLDTTADANLFIEYQYPPRRPDPPPKVGVAFAFNNQVIYTRDPNNDDYVWFSDPDQPEYVSQEVLKGNNFIVPSNDDDVTGVGASGATLVVFKNKSIYSINGEIAASKFTVSPVAAGSNIGAVNHHCIASVGSLLYFLHTNGVYALAENNIFPTDTFGNPVPLSTMIDRYFRNTSSISNKKFRLNRATAINYTKDNEYLLFLPCEADEGLRVANTNSIVLCYDYQGKNWFEWTRVNAAGGFYITQDNLYWQERRLVNDEVKSNTYKQHRKYRLIDQVDHVTPIRVTWTSSWEDLGQPRMRKKFIRCVLLFDSITAVYQQNQPAIGFASYGDWHQGIADTKTNVTTKIQSSTWNTQPWDWVEWSGDQDTFITIPLKGGSVRKSLQVEIQMNHINTSFSLQGFQLEIAKDFRKTVAK